MLQYVILPADRIGEVMRGERRTLPVTAHAKVGSTLAVKTARNRRPTVLLIVLACEPDPGGFVLTVRLHPFEHQPRLLAQDSSRGYTHDPRLAMPREPEAVGEGELELFVRDAAVRHGHQMIARTRRDKLARELLPWDERVQAAYAAAERNYRVPMLREDFRTLRHMARNKRPPHVQVQQLERIERVAYGDSA